MCIGQRFACSLIFFIFVVSFCMLHFSIKIYWTGKDLPTVLVVWFFYMDQFDMSKKRIFLCFNMMQKGKIYVQDDRDHFPHLDKKNAYTKCLTMWIPNTDWMQIHILYSSRFATGPLGTGFICLLGIFSATILNENGGKRVSYRSVNICARNKFSTPIPKFS